MVLTTVLITGGVVATGSKVYLERKRKKKGYWASYAEKIEAKTKPRKSSFATRAVNGSILTPFFSSGLFKLLPRIGEGARLGGPDTPDSNLEADMTAGAENADLDQAVKSADQHFAVSVASLGLAVTGTILFPPLRLLGWMGYFYASAHFYKGAYKCIVEERKLKMVVVDAVMFTGILATGSLVAGTLMCSLIWLAEKLLLKTEDRSRKSLVNIFGNQPRSVWVLKDGIEVELPFEQLSAGDTIVVNAGEVIAADGTIISGTASIDQHMSP